MKTDATAKLSVSKLTIRMTNPTETNAVVNLNLEESSEIGENSLFRSVRRGDIVLIPMSGSIEKSTLIKIPVKRPSMIACSETD